MAKKRGKGGETSRQVEILLDIGDALRDEGLLIMDFPQESFKHEGRSVTYLYAHTLDWASEMSIGHGPTAVVMVASDGSIGIEPRRGREDDDVALAERVRRILLSGRFG
jgi:hypothetical protein